MASKPTQRTNILLRKHGWRPVIVEHWNPHVGIRQDYLGFIDIIAHKAGRPDLAIQATSGSNAASRVVKILEKCPDELDLYLQSGSHIVEVWGWRQVGPAGKRKLWKVRRLRIAIGDGERDYVASEQAIDL